MGRGRGAVRVMIAVWQASVYCSHRCEGRKGGVGREGTAIRVVLVVGMLALAL